MYKCTSVYTVIGPFTQCSMKIYEHLYCSQEQHIHYAFIKQNKTRELGKTLINTGNYIDASIKKCLILGNRYHIN